MKRLSEFKNEDGVIVVAKLLQPIFRIVQAMKDEKRPDNMTAMDFVAAMLAKSPKDVVEIFAILSETPVEEYNCSGASILADTIALVSDRELMELFGLQSQTPTSSGSVSENTEAQRQ